MVTLFEAGDLVVVSVLTLTDTYVSHVGVFIRHPRNYTRDVLIFASGELQWFFIDDINVKLRVISALKESQ